MAGPIYINGVSVVRQPDYNGVNENPEQIQTDQYSIDGSMQRDNMGKKNRVTLKWSQLPLAVYQTLIAAFDAGVVTYKNTSSNVAGGVLEFDGLATYEQQEFTGPTLNVPFEVTIRET